MSRPKHHVFICNQGRPAGHPRGSCSEKGCKAVNDEFFKQWQERKLFDTVLVASSSCLGPCQMGATVLVYPEGIMYGNVKPEQVSEIFDQHLIGGKVVEHLQVPASIW